MVKKQQPFTTSSQVKNTLQEVVVSLQVYTQKKTSQEQIQRIHVDSECKVQTRPD